MSYAISRRPITLSQDKIMYGLMGVMALSGFVFVEPAPYDLALLALGAIALLCGLRVPAKLAILIFLFIVIIISGVTAALNSSQLFESAKHYITTSYLIISTIILASLIASAPEKAMRMLMYGYIFAALATTIAGLMAYFSLLPGADSFLLYGRVRGAFKDPNVFAPYLIPPLLFMVYQVTTKPGKYMPLQLLGSLILISGILLSFSRGAWGHLVVSLLFLFVMVMIVLPSNLSRLKLTGLALLGIVAIALLLGGLLASGSIADQFTQRAQLTQNYDAGGRGRFNGQVLALSWILTKPLGAGFGEFARYWGEQAHNVYISQFLFTGWIGGISYIVLVVLTLARGFVFVRYNIASRPYLIVFLASFCGLAFEGLLIDTDHWRHFYLDIAVIWGITTAPWQSHSHQQST